MPTKKIKMYTMNQMKDKFIGKRGSSEREEYEMKLKEKLLKHDIAMDRFDNKTYGKKKK